ncbi:MAG: amidohydrolase family protein [Janthinobacterium lividum]
MPSVRETPKKGWDNALRIDAHHHLWRYEPLDYPWIGDDLAVLRRDFLPEDLRAVMNLAKVDAAIAVQARPSLKETYWLLGQAADNATFCGVVGWVSLAMDALSSLLDELASRQKLVGFREMTQDEPAGYLDQQQIQRGIALLTARDYCYDLLIRSDQLIEATHLVDRHPHQLFVLDHAAKPPIRAGRFEPWSSSLHDLAKRDNVVCKVSGLVTEADWNQWDPDTLRPYLDALVEAFGPSRLLAGSDWPVCLLATDYQHWWTVLEQYFGSFSEDERRGIFGGNAQRVYRLFPTMDSAAVLP